MNSKKDTLTEYYSKRNFKTTPEPTERRKAKKQKKRIFVIQQHHAHAMHYDLRIEDDGVLKSWAIPKGPSLDPQDKRLALPTEDHPLEYATFEGVIPPGNYGAGPVLLWDKGTYRNLKEPLSIDECLANGELLLWLEGKKLQGAFALIRTHLHEKDSWLFIKMRDEKARDNYSVTLEQPESVKSFKTIDQLTPIKR